MNAKDFLELKLRNLLSKFEEIKVRYEYRSNTRSHLVEVVPLNFFEENKEFFIEETKIEDEFEKLFPSENVIFISDNSLTEIKEVQFKLGYNNISFVNNCLSIDFIVKGYIESANYQTINNYALAA